MIKSQKNCPSLNSKPSYFKLNRKKQINSITQIEREEEIGLERIHPNKYLLNFRTQTQGNQRHHKSKQGGSLLKKYVQTRSRQKQMAFLHGTTPFQSRKIMQKNKTSKTLSRILQKNKVQQQLSQGKKNYLMVQQVLISNKQTEQKPSDNIRQTDTTLKQDLNSSNNMLKLSQSNIFDEQKRLLNSWVFHNSHVDLKNKSKNHPGNPLKATKMTLKQLWKSKFQLGIGDQDIKNEVSSIKSKSKQRVRQKVTMTGYKKQKKEKEKKQEPFPRQTTIHSRSKPKASSYYHYPQQMASTILKIQPCPVQKPTANINFLARNKSICWSESQKKMELRQSISKPSPKAKANFSCKKIKTQQNFQKQVCAWQYANDVTERQHFF